MSKISCLLDEEKKLLKLQSTTTKEDGQENDNDTVTVLDPLDQQTLRNLSNENDPLYWASKAIQTAPTKPFGYMALSLVHPQHEVRLENLHKAIQLANDLESCRIIWIGLLVRSLIEPRQRESLQVRGSLGKAASSHPSRRTLNMAEQQTYQTICSALDEFWNRSDDGASTTQQQQKHASDMEIIAKAEYRLGLFFRKMQPIAVYRRRSRAHFHRVLDRLPQHHQQHGLWSLAQFWLATLIIPEEGDEVDDNDCRDSCEAVAAIDRCPKEYIVGLYSTFAEGFDQLLLDKLSYQTPQKLRAWLDELQCVRNRDNKPLVRTIDLGCGTGLSGLAFRDCTLHLEGIDLSPEMIRKAQDTTS